MRPWIINAGIVLYACLFGFGFVVMKYVLGYVDPLAIFQVRVLVAVACFAPLALRRWPKQRVPIIDWVRVVSSGLVGVVLCGLLFVFGLRGTTASHSSVIFGSIPVLTLIYARWFRSEQVSGRRFVGFFISLLGIAYLMKIETFSLNQAAHIGNLVIFLNANGVALYLVMVRPLTRTYSSFWISGCLFFVGMISIAPIGFPAIGQQSWVNLTLLVWLGLFYVSFCMTVLTYLLGVWLLRHTTSSHVSQSIYLQTLLAITAGSLMLGEGVSARLLVSTGLVFGGVALAQDVDWNKLTRKIRARS